MQQVLDTSTNSPLDEVRENRGWFFGIGAVSIILGTLAIIRPDIAGLATNGLIGALLVVSGVATLVHAARNGRWRGAWMSTAAGVLDVVVGTLLLVMPIAGVAALTLLLAAWLLVAGALRLALAWRHRPDRGWLWIGAGGVLSLVLGAIIAVGWPGTSAFAIGVIVGIHLMFAGWAMVMLAASAGRRADTTPAA